MYKVGWCRGGGVFVVGGVGEIFSSDFNTEHLLQFSSVLDSLSAYIGCFSWHLIWFKKGMLSL